jgi:IS30 family transposase
LEGAEVWPEGGDEVSATQWEKRSVPAALRLVGLKPAEIAREVGRHRSTVSRELKRNAAPYDGKTPNQCFLQT